MNINFAFFGTDNFSVVVLEELKKSGLLPKLIVTVPDRPAGRGQKMHQSEVKIWATENSLPILQNEKLDDVFIKEITDFAVKNNFSWDVFALASYGKIVPKSVLEICSNGILNVHPSLLPKYRGASPIESAILNDDKITGVTIMLMDEKMDNGPILEQAEVKFPEWTNKISIEKTLAQKGGEMLAQNIIKRVEGNSKPIVQNHSEATFTKKISKPDGFVDFELIKNIKVSEIEKQRELFLKIIALNPWPGVYSIFKHNEKDTRVKITEAKWINESIEILKVIPEGRKEMSWQSFHDGFMK